MKDKIKSTIIRNKYLIYFIIGIIGILLIIIACFALKSCSKVYDVLLGIGCSIVASAGITVFLLLMLSSSELEQDDLNEWGIEKIYEERQKIFMSESSLPKRQLDIIAFGLNHFRNANAKKIENKIKRGLQIRIVSLHPKSKYIVEYEKYENTSGIRDDINALINWVNDIKKRTGKTNPKIELKLYDSLPLDFYCRSDNKIYVGPYITGTVSGKNITYKFDMNKKGGSYYSEIFESIWQGERPIELIAPEAEYLLGNQKDCIENILQYFCDKFKGRDGNDVIAVVVIFKGPLRRTFFSYNKKNGEKHHCYSKNAGALGKMLELNSNWSSATTLFFRDYSENISIVDTWKARSRETRKCDIYLEKFKEDEMCAIISAPILMEQKIIGAVTFDFSKCCSEYSAAVESLKQYEIDTPISEDNLISVWFSDVLSCAGMIAPMLSIGIETPFKRLYEEDWKIDGSGI